MLLNMGAEAGDGNANDETPAYLPQLNSDALINKNTDFIAWIYYPGLDLSYPVVQGEDNSFYLNHTFLKEKNSSGCIFLDCIASSNLNDRNTFVFGHNRNDESMFGGLKRLLKADSICEKYPEIYIFYNEKWYTYEIFSVYETKNGSDRYQIPATDEEYDTYVEWATTHSEIKNLGADIDWKERPDLLTLSTCYGNAGTNKRILVQCALKYSK